MELTLAQVISWLIVGALTGALIGRVFKKKRGGETWANLGIGLAGAVVGGVIVGVLNIDLGLGEVKVTLESLVAAVLGALLLLLVLSLRKRGGVR